eukprot:768537-Hanusia_phi.AAC.9
MFPAAPICHVLSDSTPKPAAATSWRRVSSWHRPERPVELSMRGEESQKRRSHLGTKRELFHEKIVLQGFPHPEDDVQYNLPTYNQRDQSTLSSLF